MGPRTVLNVIKILEIEQVPFLEDNKCKLYTTNKPEATRYKMHNFIDNPRLKPHHELQ